HGEGGEAGHDERFAALAGGNHAVLVHGRGHIVVGEEDGKVGHVAVHAVRVSCPHGELVRLAAFEDQFPRQDLHRGGRGDVGAVVGGAGGDPLDQCLDVLTVGGQRTAARVRDAADRFLNQQ